jgi:hypothetical protein
MSKPEEDNSENEKNFQKSSVYAAGQHGESRQPKLGSVNLPQKIGRAISAYAIKRGFRGFSDLTRFHFEALVKDFTDTFRGIPSETVEIFGDLEEVDGEVKIKLNGYNEEDLLEGRRVIAWVLGQFDWEVERRGLTSKVKEEEAEEGG